MILKPFRDPVTGVYNGSAKVTRKNSERVGDEMEACLDLIDADNVSLPSIQYASSKLPPSIMPCPNS